MGLALVGIPEAPDYMYPGNIFVYCLVHLTGGLNCAFVSGGERESGSMHLYPLHALLKKLMIRFVLSCYSAYDGIPLCQHLLLYDRCIAR